MSGTGRAPRINPLVAGFLAGVLIAFIVGVMATINLQYGAPWADTKTLTAQVTDADSMSVGSDVRIGGRLVGQVTSIKAAGDHTDITFHVDGVNWPLPADTTANVRLATLLGQKYIQLNPGHSSQTLADHGVIGLKSTTPVVDFDQILNTFDKPTRDALTSLIRTVAGGVQNQEGTLQQLFPDLSDLSVHSKVPTHELVARNSQLNNILINLGITADQLNASRDDLAAVITSFNSINAALASNQGQALKSYIANTDVLNQTTDLVLNNGSAATLDNALKKLATPQGGGFFYGLNTLLTSLIPQTSSFSHVAPGAQASDMKNGTGGVPAKASVDLIYEIGSATSQGDASGTFGGGNHQGNFWLRQNVAGADPCGLLPLLCGLPSGLPIALPTPGGSNPLCIPIPGLPCITLPTGVPPLNILHAPCIPGVTCNSNPLPVPLPPLPVPVPTLPIPNCVPGLTPQCPVPGIPCAVLPNALCPTSLTQCTPIATLPTCPIAGSGLPTLPALPSLGPVGISWQTTGSDAFLGYLASSDSRSVMYPERYR
jgi:virulence factor Mce-like protein